MNIRFKNIVIDNFLSLGHVEVPLDSRGFVMVKGINNETDKTQSNGSGKSSIFDAIFWTITGETLRGTTEVINEKFKNVGCTCTLTLLVNDIEYVITRVKGHPERGNYCCVYERGILLSDQIKKSQEIINQTISIAVTSDILGSIILLGQRLPYRFSNLTPIKRKDLLELMSGSSNKIEKLKFQLDKKIGEETVKSQNFLGQINTLNGENTGLSISKNNIESQIKARKPVDEINTEIKNLTNKNTELSINLEQYKKDEIDSNTKLDSLNQIKTNVNNYIIQQNSLKSQAITNLNSIKSGVCPTCGRPYDVSEESLRDKKKFEDEIIKINRVIAGLNDKMKGITEQYNSVDTVHKTALNNINSTTLIINNNTNEIKRLEGLLKDSENWSDKIKEIDEHINTNLIKINDLTIENGKIKNILDNLDYLKRIVSKEFKGYMLEGVINFISDKAAYYGDYVFKNTKISIKLDGNKISILLGNRLYENLSGGERQRVDLCVQFALRDMLSTVTGFTCNMIVLDEVFDNLDAQGTNDLINLITKEFNDIESIYIITHHTDISVPYDDRLVIIKNKEGVSYLE